MAKIGIIMGSNSDWHIMEHAAKMLQQFGVDYEPKSFPPTARPI